MLSGKGPIRTTLSSSWPCTEHTKNLRVPESVVQTQLELYQAGAVTTFLGSLFQCPNTLWVKQLLLISNLNLP